MENRNSFHDSVIKWKPIPRHWPFMTGVHRSPVARRSVTRSFDVFFDRHLNQHLSKQCTRPWFETLSRSLWRHCNVTRQSQHHGWWPGNGRSQGNNSHGIHPCLSGYFSLNTRMVICSVCEFQFVFAPCLLFLRTATSRVIWYASLKVTHLSHEILFDGNSSTCC